MMKTTVGTAMVLGAALAMPASGQELLTNPTFDGPPVGDGWGSFGAAGFHSFFGPNGHASLFADNAGNFGGVFQTGIAGSEGTEYLFELLDVRIESSFDASLRFGLEYYDGADSSKLGETIVSIDTSTTGDGLSFSMTGTAVPGTVFVRPIVLFDNVNPGYAGQGQANVFVFDSSLTVVPTPTALSALVVMAGLMLRRTRMA
ncbi:MAG: hypothetical protein RIG82_06250 [Phycisphaeraceae bacterium]